MSRHLEQATRPSMGYMSAIEGLTRLREELRAREELARQRDAAIVESRREGAPWDMIAEAAGMSTQACQAAAKRANDGVIPMPREGSRFGGARPGRVN